MRTIFFKMMLGGVAIIAIFLTGCKKPSKDSASRKPNPADLPQRSSQASSVHEQPILSERSSTPHERLDNEVEQLLLRGLNHALPKEERLSAIDVLGKMESHAATKALVSLIVVSAEDRKMGATMTGSAAYPAVRELKKRGAKAAPYVLERLFELVQAQGNPTEIRLLCMTSLLLEPRDVLIQRLHTIGETKRYPAEVTAKVHSLIHSFGTRTPPEKSKV